MQPNLRLRGGAGLGPAQRRSALPERALDTARAKMQGTPACLQPNCFSPGGFEAFLDELGLTGSGPSWVAIDEIGNMECLSERFCNLVRQLLGSEIPLVATVAQARQTRQAVQSRMSAVRERSVLRGGVARCPTLRTYLGSVRLYQIPESSLNTASTP